jgi:hypothetical protein
MIEFFHHRQTEQWLMSGVDQHMDADEASKEIPLMD